MRGPRVHPHFQLDPQVRKKQMQLIMEIIGHLYDFFKDEDKAIMWLDNPNKIFKGKRPVDLINNGQATLVDLYLRLCKKENSPPEVGTH